MTPLERAREDLLRQPALPRWVIWCAVIGITAITATYAALAYVFVHFVMKAW